MKKTLTIIGLAVATLAGAQAQVLYTTGNYTQNFNTLAQTSTTNTWTDNSTLTGWYATGLTSGTYAGDTGSSTSGDLYSYGVAGTNVVGDRALGSLASGSTGNLTYGVALKNNGAFTLTSFSLTYDGEQWRRGNNSTQRAETLSFSYQIFNAGAGSINAGSGWTPISELNFTSPNATLATAGALDGNASGNRVAGIAGSASSLSWGAGQELWVRWTDLNDSGTDHGMAIDNVNFSAVPEPQTWALIGIGAYFMIWNFRRRRAQV